MVYLESAFTYNPGSTLYFTSSNTKTRVRAKDMVMRKTFIYFLIKYHYNLNTILYLGSQQCEYLLNFLQS